METKKIFALLGLILMAVACEREAFIESDRIDDYGISIDLSLPETPRTKASLEPTSATYEQSVNTVQILVFSNSTGMLEKYLDAGTVVSGISLDLSKGSKQVWAVVNGPDMAGVGNVSALKSKTLSLGSDNGISEAKGFVMAGCQNIDISASSTSCVVEVERFVSRITLGKVTNSLPKAYGEVKIKSAVLINVVGNQNVEGTAQASDWLNKFGRADESPQVSAHVIDGVTYKASCPELTFRSIDKNLSNGSSLIPSAPYCFYTMPNSSTVSPLAFSSQFKAQRTLLVVTAELSGKKYYYPVALDGAVLERNKSYSVSINIVGPGSSDPNEPVVKSVCAVSITVQDWQKGTDYSVEI